MRKLFLLFAIILVCAPAGFAQSDYSDWEFFVGYAHERANNGADRLDARGRIINANGTTQRADFVSKRVSFNGVTTELVANVHRNVGLVANFSGTWGSHNFTDASLAGGSMHVWHGIRYSADRALIGATRRG